MPEDYPSNAVSIVVKGRIYSIDQTKYELVIDIEEVITAQKPFPTRLTLKALPNQLINIDLTEKLLFYVNKKNVIYFLRGIFTDLRNKIGDSEP